MKSSVLFVVLLMQSGCTLANPATTKFTVKVEDAETGLPVTNAVAKANFILKYDPWGAKKNEYNQAKVQVNADGMAVISGKTIRRTGGGLLFLQMDIIPPEMDSRFLDRMLYSIAGSRGTRRLRLRCGK
ncbi:hypothetical protein EGM51_16990 [Verrucomicrobia bacterium S94]|nr:hypothetical protein EGM51_16990 [Verrucomicrobia bacterium S94]